MLFGKKVRAIKEIKDVPVGTPGKVIGFATLEVSFDGYGSYFVRRDDIELVTPGNEKKISYYEYNCGIGTVFAFPKEHGGFDYQINRVKGPIDLDQLKDVSTAILNAINNKKGVVYYED